MYKDIYDLIRIKSNKGRILSKNDIKYIVNRIASVYKIDKYNLGVNVLYRPYDYNASAFYCQSDNHIYINTSKIKRYYFDESFYFINMFLLYALLHEITHVEQVKFIRSNSLDNIDDPLVKLEYYMNKTFEAVTTCRTKECLAPTVEELKVMNYASVDKDENFDKNLDKLYDFYHDELPCERIANIRGLKFVISFIEANSSNKMREKLTLAAFNSCLYEQYIGGYNKSELDYYPVIKYMSIFGFEKDIPYIKDLIQQINDEYNLDKETKMEYGLDIDDSTLNYANEQHDKYYEEIKKLNKE